MITDKQSTNLRSMNTPVWVSALPARPILTSDHYSGIFSFLGFGLIIRRSPPLGLSVAVLWLGNVAWFSLNLFDLTLVSAL